MGKKVSIILPVYNGENRIARSIESIVNQSYGNIEVIIVNDCSTDNTSKILDSYVRNDNRIRVLQNVTNLKLPKSLNVGFRQATGEYLTWTSDDNQYHQNAIETMVGFLDKHEDIDLVYTDFSKKYLDGTIKDQVKCAEPNYLRFGNTVGACFLYRKSIANYVGEYDPDLFLAEDYEYWIRMYLNGELFHLSLDLYDYGWHDKSLTATKQAEIHIQTFRAKAKHEKALLLRCKTLEDRKRFYDSQLQYLDDKEVYRKIRRKYYEQDGWFMIYDLMRRAKRKIFMRKVVLPK